MPSSWPKCHRVLEEDEICCAQIRYTWRCKSCSKLTTGFAIPYGKCFMCGGELEVLTGRDLGDSMRFRAIREAVELSADEQNLLSNWLFRGIHVTEDSGVAELYQAALEMECRTRDHFRKLAQELPAGLERDLCGELAAEEEEHVAMLETELEQLG